MSERSARANGESTDYPAERIHRVTGLAEDTLPVEARERVAFPRLDTAWCGATKHELATLFPRLAVGGALIIDECGECAGARRAVDEHVAEPGHRALLTRVDYRAGIAVEQGARR